MKNIKAFVIISAILLLSGCYDMREVDETAYIIALGIDKAEADAYTYTIQLANPLEMSGGEEGAAQKSDSSSLCFVAKAPDFYSAKNQLNNFLSKSVDMSHLKLIILSKELENSEFLQHSQFLMHEREVRPHTHVAIASGTAEEFLKSVKPTLEANTSKYYELMALRPDSLYSPSVTISSFLDHLSSNGKAAVLPLAHSSTAAQSHVNYASEFWVSSGRTVIESENAYMSGMAIFKNGNIYGFMDGDSALIYNILSGRIRSCDITLKNPADTAAKLVFKLNIPKAADYEIKLTDNKYQIILNLPLDIKFVGNFLPQGFATENELYNFARQIISKKITAFVYDISRTKTADILNIGSAAKGQSDTLQNWQNIFETAEFIVNINK